ncbi:MAG: hypothetical protein MUQ32_06800 [Chloroflexi bacterium]|nr:hypothetical protein [Chloroflexota bacterium]
MDRDAALNLIDELRVAVPEEVRAAKRINSEGERIIEKAQEEAERIVARAQEQAAFLIGERGLTEAADAESGRLIAEAEDESDQVRHGADDSAAGVLAALAAEVTRTLRGIERGAAMLEERRAAYADPQALLAQEADSYDDVAEGEIGEEEQGVPPAGRR